MSEHEIMIEHLERLRRDEVRLNATIENEVAVARFAGLSWSQIGNALGVTRQAAHARFRAVEKDSRH